MEMKLVGVVFFLLTVVSVPSCLSFQTTLTNQRWGLSTHQNIVRSTRLASLSTPAKTPGSAKLDTPWEELGFEFRPTNSHVRINYKDGEWGKPELVQVRTGS